MLSSIRPPVDIVEMKYNMTWDGIFHAFTWLMVSLGVWRLWVAGGRSDVPWSTRTFVGSLIMGWGLFNFIEGIIDHQILGIHHVHPGTGELAWDLGFVLFGLAEITGGWLAIRGGRSGQSPRGGLAAKPHAAAENPLSNIEPGHVPSGRAL
jgi:uncharacterized membrane protein